MAAVKFLLATSNPGKLREYRVLAGSGEEIALDLLPDFALDVAGFPHDGVELDAQVDEFLPDRRELFLAELVFLGHGLEIDDAPPIVLAEQQYRDRLHFAGLHQC